MEVSEAVKVRISCRAFENRPVPKDLLEQILCKASQAPSGGNLQPWHVFVVTGSALREIVEDVAEAMKTTPRGEGSEYRVYPENLKEPYFSRRFKCGEDLYASIGVSREDKDRRLEQFRRNFRLFDAPVGLFFYIDRQMQPGQWADLGMYMQTIMLLACEHGLATCAQEAWAAWPKLLASHLQPDPDLMLFSGMAMGYADEQAAINALRTDRASLSEVAFFRGFE